MKIAISASSPQLDSPVDPRFGRCPYYLIVDPETKEFEAVENPHVGASSGAGIQAAQLVAQRNVEAVLTGSCGPNAFQTLKAVGVKVIVGVTGTVSEAVRKYASGGEFREAGGPDVPAHYGMGAGAGTGRGRGMAVAGKGIARAVLSPELARSGSRTRSDVAGGRSGRAEKTGPGPPPPHGPRLRENRRPGKEKEIIRLW